MDPTTSAAMFLLPAGLVIVIYQSLAAVDQIPEAPVAFGLFSTGARLHLLAQRDGGHWHLRTIGAIMAVFARFSTRPFIGSCFPSGRYKCRSLLSHSRKTGGLSCVRAG
ncbi:MAG: hypothetical protein AAFY38_00820 [Pseudomonadota bacterium]